MHIKHLSAIFLLIALSLSISHKTEACTRAVYLGENGLFITGRTMDWKEKIPTNLYILPRGIFRQGYDTGNTVRWTSRYGSIVASGYEMGTSEGMNEKGLVASLLYLPETVYSQPGDTRPIMGISIWAQYVLDNFATVSEAVEDLQKDAFRIDAPSMPNGSASTLHMAITDTTGNSAIIEYLDGKISIHEGRQYRVLTNSPSYDKQLAINEYWQNIGGLVMLPGTNRSSDRFTRASFYIGVLPRTASHRDALAGVFGVMRNVSVPLGITTPQQPEISSTRWRSVSDQTNKVYYFESTLSPNTFWVDLKKMDFNPKSGIKKLTLTDGEIYTGEANRAFKPSKPFQFLFRLPQ